MKINIIFLSLLFIPSLALTNVTSVLELVSTGIFRAADLDQWAQEYQQKSTSSELCLELSNLADSDLVYFESLVTSTASSQLDCQKQLAFRIQNYNQKKIQQHFQNYFQSRSKERHSFKRLRGLSPAPRVPDRPELGKVDTTNGSVLSTGNLPAGYIAFTFDDGPHPSLTPQLLDLLNRYSVEATFFSVGKNVNSHPAIIRDLYREGHSYGSHTITHPNLAKISYGAAVNEIQGGLNALTKVTGVEMRFFRFPYGSATTRLRQYLKREGLASFFWNLDSLDWKHRDPTRIHNEIVQQVNQKRRGIMLFHDIVGATPAAVETLLLELTRKGYKIVHFRPTSFL